MPRPSRRRPRLFPWGITRRAEGWRISIRVKGKLIQRSFAPATEQADVEAELAKLRKSQTAGREEADDTGTFGADVTRYLTDYFTGKSGLKERKRHLKLWTEALGKDTLRADVARDDIARVLNGWRGAGLAADTCNKRRTALLALYHALDGRGGSNPVREIPKFRSPDPLPRGLAYDLIEKALGKMPLCKTQARLRVLAYTGMRAGQLMKLTPGHWDHKGHSLTVPGTDKGRGTKPYVVPLSKQAQDALKVFDGLECWGVFTVAPMARMWKEAATAAKLPEGTVPYDLRHSFGTAIYRATGDLKVTKELLGHSAIRMSERYTLAAIPARKLSAVKAFQEAVHIKRGGRK